MLHNLTSSIPIDIIDNALRGAITIFISMTIFAFILAYLGVDLSWMMILMLAALIGLLIASLLVMIFAKKSSKIHKIILIIGLVIFSVYVMIYTNTILQPHYDENFVDAALNFYLDFINIFTRIAALEAE
jgi:FtsH-binding integral membrane protein